MKTIIILTILSAFCLNAKAQDIRKSEVPEAVKKKFASLYPTSREPKWEKEDGRFEAEFILYKIETSVLFEADGSLVQTETEIPISSLPAEISDYVSNNLGGKTITEAAKIVDANGNISYEAEIENTDYLFDANGKLIRIEDEVPGDKEDTD